jgi:hypothetical protein
MRRSRILLGGRRLDTLLVHPRSRRSGCCLKRADERRKNGVVLRPVRSNLHRDDVREGSQVESWPVALLDNVDAGGDVAVPNPGVVGALRINEDVDGSRVSLPSSIELDEVARRDRPGELRTVSLLRVQSGEGLRDAF